MLWGTPSSSSRRVQHWRKAATMALEEMDYTRAAWTELHTRGDVKLKNFVKTRQHRLILMEAKHCHRKIEVKPFIDFKCLLHLCLSLMWYC